MTTAVTPVSNCHQLWTAAAAVAATATAVAAAVATAAAAPASKSQEGSHFLEQEVEQ